MSSQQKLLHLQSIIQLTEYIDSLIQLDKDFTSDELKQNPLPEVQPLGLTMARVQQRFSRLVGKESSENQVPRSTATPVPQSSDTISRPIIENESKPKAVSPPRQPVQHQQPKSPKKQAQSTASLYSNLNPGLKELFDICARLFRQATDIFVNPVSAQLSSTYAQNMPQPMCYAIIGCRLAATARENITPDIYSESDGNLLVNVDRKAYGSAPKQLQNKADNGSTVADPQKFTKNWLEISTKLLKSLSVQPERYKTVTEVARDFVLVYTNCWYWNYKTPQLVDFARDGLIETRKLFTKVYDKFCWPYYLEYFVGQDDKLQDSDVFVAKLRQLHDWHMNAHRIANFEPEELEIPKQNYALRQNSNQHFQSHSSDVKQEYAQHPVKEEGPTEQIQQRTTEVSQAANVGLQAILNDQPPANTAVQQPQNRAQLEYRQKIIDCYNLYKELLQSEERINSLLNGRSISDLNDAEYEDIKNIMGEYGCM